MTKLFNKKALFALLAITLLVLPAQSFAANAIGAVVEAITCASAPLKCVSDAFEWITAQIGYIIAAITAQLITFSAYFIQVMIKLSGEILKSPVVTEGFKITLNLANLGFVLAVIFIAFVTIFRLQGYETKKLLRNLIVAAVLINFSFTFAGLIMDAANIFGDFFVSAIVGDSGAENITKSIASALNIHKLNNTVPEAGALNATLAVAGMYYKTLFSLAFMVLFNSVMVITFFAIAGLMVVRYIAISILLIVMPFAWLCWIFPGLYSHWKTWWNNFLKWNIFLPVLMFFVYIAAFTASKVEIAVKASGIGITSQKVAGDLTTFGATGVVDIAQGLVMVGLLFGGMIIAQKMGVAGAGAIMTGSSKVKGWVTGAAVSMTGAPLAGRLARRAGGAAVGVAQSAGVRTAGGAAGWVGKQIANKTPFKKAGAYLMSYGEAPQEARKKSIEERAKAIVSQYASKESFAAFMQSSAIGEHEKASRALAIAQKGNIEDMDKLDEEKMNGYLKAAKSAGVEKKISENNIGLASRMEDDFDMKKALSNMTAEDLAKQKPEAFTNKKVIENMDADVLENLLKSKKLAPKKMQAIIQGAAELYSEQPDHKAMDAIYANTKVVGSLKKLAEKIEEKINKKEDVSDKERRIVSFASHAPLVIPSTSKTDTKEDGDEKAKRDFLNLPK